MPLTAAPFHSFILFYRGSLRLQVLLFEATHALKSLDILVPQHQETHFLQISPRNNIWEVPNRIISKHYF